MEGNTTGNSKPCSLNFDVPNPCLHDNPFQSITSKASFKSWKLNFMGTGSSVRVRVDSLSAIWKDNTLGFLGLGGFKPNASATQDLFNQGVPLC